MTLRTMERAALQSARAAKQLRGLCVCVSARCDNAAMRIEESVVSTGTFAWGGYPDIDELFRQQDVEPALMLINPSPWSAPLEDVCLKTG